MSTVESTWVVIEDGFTTINVELDTHYKFIIIDWGTGECCEVLLEHYRGVEDGGRKCNLW